MAASTSDARHRYLAPPFRVHSFASASTSPARLARSVAAVLSAARTCSGRSVAAITTCTWFVRTFSANRVQPRSAATSVAAVRTAERSAASSRRGGPVIRAAARRTWRSLSGTASVRPPTRRHEPRSSPGSQVPYVVNVMKYAIGSVGTAEPWRTALCRSRLACGTRPCGRGRDPIRLQPPCRAASPEPYTAHDDAPHRHPAL